MAKKRRYTRRGTGKNPGGKRGPKPKGVRLSISPNVPKDPGTFREMLSALRMFDVEIVIRPRSH